jgi:Phytanoyl-CoA dioxygenase (PhyH)
MGTMARVDGMEDADGLRLTSLEDSAPLLGDPDQLRTRAALDGFLFFRRLLVDDIVSPLRRCVLDYASQIGWLEPSAAINEARAAPGRRIGDYQDPDWVSLQTHVQNRPEMWALGDAAAIHRALQAADRRSGDISLSTANICRVVSPHADMATKPHQDAHYVQVIEDFWTAWIPLVDCPRELGPLALLAGSHRGGLREHSSQNIADGVTGVPDGAAWSTTDFCCGDIVLFRPHTLHRALANQSADRLRLSVDFRYGFWTGTATVDWRAAAIGRGRIDPLR